MRRQIVRSACLLALTLVAACNGKPKPVDLEMRPLEPGAGAAPAAPSERGPSAAPAAAPQAAEAPAAAPAISDEEIARLRRVGAQPYDGTATGDAADDERPAHGRAGAGDPTSAILGNWVVSGDSGGRQPDGAGRLHFGASYYTLALGGQTAHVDYTVKKVQGNRMDVELRAGRGSTTRGAFVVDGHTLQLLDGSGNVTMRASRAD